MKEKYPRMSDIHRRADEILLDEYEAHMDEREGETDEHFFYRLNLRRAILYRMAHGKSRCL